MTIKLYHGDCIDILPTLTKNSVDTVITDPPYGLKFMSKDWDFSVPGKRFWKAVLRVAKPGAMLLAFGSTRTHHRLMCAIEDAGWQIRDVIMWVYGNGFPKSHNIGKATNAQLWVGWGTALKPAYEPIIIAMKPLEGTFANNALKWSVAGLNIDGGRVKGEKRDPRKADGSLGGTTFHGQERDGRIKEWDKHQGRWPANIIHDGSDEVVKLFPSPHGAGTKRNSKREAAGVGIFGIAGGDGHRFSDSGSAARFFYCAKASKRERSAGLEGVNKHPTVKPLALMRYLCRLTATPTGGIILDPFCGSGSTGCAAVLERRDFIGIELSANDIEVARQRIDYWEHKVDLPLFDN